MNGFCVCYLGHVGEIELGWYQNNIKKGNWLWVDCGEDPTVAAESGWYEAGSRVCDMKPHPTLKPFSLSDIFLDLHSPPNPKTA